LRIELADYREEVRLLNDENNTLSKRLEDVADELQDHIADIHRVAMREHETIEALEQALQTPNLLRLVVQGIILEYRNGG
jgi:hypothetical protein